MFSLIPLFRADTDANSVFLPDDSWLKSRECADYVSKTMYLHFSKKHYKVKSLYIFTLITPDHILSHTHRSTEAQEKYSPAWL